MSEARYVRVAALKTAALFRSHLESSGIDLGFDDALVPPAESPFAQPFVDGPVRVGNRFCVLPMEGWDGTTDWRAERSDPPPLAALRRERRQAHLGRRSRRRAARRPRQSQPAPHVGAQRAVARLAPRRARHRAPRALRLERGQRPLSRPPAHALGPLLAPERLESPRAARRARQSGPRQAVPRRRAR